MSSALSVFLLSLAVASSVNANQNTPEPSFQYGKDIVRGVNIGGWLVTEPWITPKLYDDTNDDRIIDEWTFGLYQPKEVAEAAMKRHWDAFITEEDFKEIAAANLTHVRLPIGYWAFDVQEGEPFIQGQLPYLQKAVDWAEKYGLKVIPDMHGGVGSQNGFDNSGQTLPFPLWHTNQTNIDRTVEAVRNLTKMFLGRESVVSAIATLNEPAGFHGDAIVQAAKGYWKSSYAAVRNPDGPQGETTNFEVVIHDAFQPLDSWKGFMPKTEFPCTAMDTHRYHMFTPDLIQLSNEDHIAQACRAGKASSSFTDMPLIVGEWSPASNDCAKYLNGRGNGTRYEGTLKGDSFGKKFGTGSCVGQSGDASTMTQEYKDFLKKFWEAQVVGYEKGSAGWLMWTWKTEDVTAQDWSYKAGLANGWIKTDFSSLNTSICDGF